MIAREQNFQNETQPTIAGKACVSGCFCLSSLKFRTDIPKIIVQELIDFINLFEIQGLRRPTIYKFFENIRDSYVTTDFETIWQLSRSKAIEQKNTGHIIFMDMATRTFFIEILDEILKVNPKYIKLRSFLK